MQNNKEMKTGTELIGEERQRQIEVEGWTGDHDAKHQNGDLANAAGCYVAYALSRIMEEANHTNQSPLAKFVVYDFGESDFLVNSGDRGDRRVRKAGWKEWWPWDRKWWKPSQDDQVKNLIKAGALIAAEIDRLQNIKP